MIVERRTFFCKVGKAGPATELAKEFLRVARDVGYTAGHARLYTDLMGKSDRVIWEGELETFVNPREAEKKFFGHPDAGRLFQQMSELIDGAEVEYFALEHSE
jgi:hypothetical protein